jgi:copper chaperone NosL
MKKLIILPFIIFLLACSREPQQINYSKDICDFCKMTIMDKRFAAECISSKGKIFKFDDAHCMIEFLKNGGIWSNEVAGIYFADFHGNESWICSEKAFFLKSDLLHSPMGGNLATFNSKQEAEKIKMEFNGDILLWNDIKPKK